MQVPILSGVMTDESAAFRNAMPINREPIFTDSGISKGYLGPVSGAVSWSTGNGLDRGAINWNDTCYRVMGGNLVSVGIAGFITILGSVGNDLKPVSMDYSFDRLAIASNGNLFYWNATEGITQVTDPDLGVAIDVIFVDGRFMTTDGTSLVITDLNDPYSVDPLKYGSAETDPDPINALAKVRGEIYAIGRYTCQNFSDVGGTGFPFANNPGGLIPRGSVGRKAWCYFLEQFAFVGSARDEMPSVYVAGAGTSKSISTQEVDTLLGDLTPEQLAAVEMEQRVEKNEQRLLVHLPDQTIMYLNQASQSAGEPIWVVLRGGTALDQPYPVRHIVACYGKWLCGSPDGDVGYLDDAMLGFFGDLNAWQFQTNFLYNESNGGIVHELELVGLPGRQPLNIDARIFMSSSMDGETWSEERAIRAGKVGQRQQRLVWRPNRRFANYMAIRFRGMGDSFSSFARLEAQVEPLNG